MQAQGPPNGLGDLGLLPLNDRNTIYKMVLEAETPIELIVEMNRYGRKNIAIAQRDLRVLRTSRAIYNEAIAISSHRKFFVIVNGPSYTGKNLQDLQHGVDALLRLLTTRRARNLELVLQESLVHGDLWANLDSVSIVKIADLVVRGVVKVTINNRTIPVLGGAGQATDLPTINITVPQQQMLVFQILRTIFLVAASHQAMPVPGGLDQFIESRLRSIPPGQPSPHVLHIKLPLGLVLRSTLRNFRPDLGSQVLDIAQDIADPGRRGVQLAWCRITLRSLGKHRINIQREVKSLLEAQDGVQPPCFLGVGEGFFCYNRTMDFHSDASRPVDQRLQRAQEELEATRRNIRFINKMYQRMRPLNR
jgi:hypothetical protein